MEACVTGLVVSKPFEASERIHRLQSRRAALVNHKIRKRTTLRNLTSLAFSWKGRLAPIRR